MKPYEVTEETPTRLWIRIKKNPSVLFIGVGFLFMGVLVLLMIVVEFHLCFLGFGLILTIVGIAVIYEFTVQYDWTFNKKDGTVIHETMNMFHQSVVRQEYNLRDIQHAFIDEVEDDENSRLVYKYLALKLASGETIRLTSDCGEKQDLQDVDRINAWMKSGGV